MIQAGIQAAARLAETSNVEVEAESAESRKVAGGRTVH